MNIKVIGSGCENCDKTNAVVKECLEELGIDTVYTQLLPADKVAKVEELLAQHTDGKGKVAFVGDGINDAPVLSRADIGIAMGSMGSDAAIEAAVLELHSKLYGAEKAA